MSGDPLWGNVALLINGNGENDSTTIAEETGKSATAENGAMYKTDVNLCNGSAIYLPGATGRVKIPANSSFNLMNHDFCIEVLSRPSFLDVNGRHIINQSNNLANNNNRAFGIGMSQSSMYFYWTTNGLADNNIGIDTPFVANQVYHIEVDKKDGVLYFFSNGVLIGTHPHNYIIFSSTADLCIGAFGRYAEDGYPNLSWLGHVAGIRITNGAHRHTDSFTPPALPLPIGPQIFSGQGMARFTDGAIASLVRIWDADTGAHVANATPDQNSGEFAVSSTKQDVYATIIRQGYRPLTHGPITLAE